MCEVGRGVTEGTRETHMEVPEATEGTPVSVLPHTTSSPTEAPPPSRHSSVRDPLRYPFQNGFSSSSEERFRRVLDDPSGVTSSCIKPPNHPSTLDEVDDRECRPADHKSSSNSDDSMPMQPHEVSPSVNGLSGSKPKFLPDLDLEMHSDGVYVPETVDFPSSPRALWSLPPESVGVRLAEGEREIAPPASTSLEDEDEERSVYTATVSLLSGQAILRKVEIPASLEVTHRKRLTVTEELFSMDVHDDQQSVSSLSVHNSEDEDDEAQIFSQEEFTDLLTPDDINTPDELEESIMERLGPFREESAPEDTAQSSREEVPWRAVILAGIERRIDMKVIEPYKKVLSHGGYLEWSKESIIVFSACFLPDRSRKDYDYVMDNLFMYVLTTLDQLIADDYVLVYLHGATTRANMPSFAWLKRCYQMIDRRLRKNLQGLYLVHPTFWVKTVAVMARPFVSSKFARKLRFVSSLRELYKLVPLDLNCIPARVKQYDEIRESLLAK